MTRLRIALVSLAVALSMFAPAAPGPVAAEETQLTAAVFAFDFSGSIYCWAFNKKDPNCNSPINDALADAVDELADNISNSEAQFQKKAIDFKVTKFGSSQKFDFIRANGDKCEGNTKNDAGLLVACLKEVARQYRTPEGNQLGGTSFSQVFSELNDYSNTDRCGLILFTDGKPDESDKALTVKLRNATTCSVLPVSTGNKQNVEIPWLSDFAKTEMTVIENCKNQEPFTWEKVFFQTPQAAVEAIGKALSEIACLKQVPEWDQCATVNETKQVLEFAGLNVVLGPSVILTEFPVGLQPSESYVARDGKVTIPSSTPVPPKGCQAPPSPTPIPSPTPTPTMPPPPPLPCLADSPLSWLGCNPWALLLLLLLIGARLWWIGRDLQVSINGQDAVALRGGTKVGFDLHNGIAERTPNPNDAQVKITRAFFRFLPGTRLDTSGLTGEVGGKPSKFELGKEIDLATGASAVVRYGNPRPYQDSSNSDEPGPSDFSGTSQGGGSSSAL